MRRELREVGEPVRLLAEQMAAGNISNIGATWSRMKLGVTSRVVYVAPRARRKGGSPRGNLRGLLETQMQQALDGRTTDVIRGFENLLDRLSNSRGF